METWKKYDLCYIRYLNITQKDLIIMNLIMSIDPLEDNMIYDMFFIKP